MKKKTLFIFVVLTLVLAACGVRAAATPAPAYAVPDTKGGTADEQYAAPAEPAYSDSGKVIASNTTVQERMVMMNADLSIIVTDPRAKMEAIDQLAKDLGGYVVSMNMYQTYTSSGDVAPEGSISIRVPSEKLDTALSQIKADVVEVRNETRSGTDVTATYVDLESQLTNLERAEQDLLAIMDEAKSNPGNDSTTKTQDVLNVYNQIVIIRGQIEQVKGQMQYYEDSTSTSAINVTIIAEETIQPIEIGGWKPEGKVRDAVQKLINFLQGFVTFLIYLVLLVLPILIVVFGPIALVIWGIVALVRRGKKKKALASKQ